MAENKETREVEIILKGQQANASLKEMAAAAAIMNNQLAKMSEDDPRRAALINSFAALGTRISETRAEMRTYVKTEAELREEAEKLNQANQQVILNGQRVSASFRDMRDAGALLERQLQEISADDPGRGKLLADYRALQTRIDGVGKEIKGLKPALDDAGKSSGFFSNAMSSALGIFTGQGLLEIAGKAFNFLKEAKGDFEASAQAGAQLEATLKSTGEAAGITKKEIEDIASARMGSTLFDDDATKASASLLLTFTNIKKGVFEEALPAIQDIAQKMAGDGPADLKGASIQLGKALNDPIKGISALTKVGVSFSDEQKKIIERLVATGDVAGAQRIILSELNKEFGGSAEAARKAGGGLATLKMNFDDTKETIGGFVVEGLNRAADWLGRLWEKTQPVRDIFVELWNEGTRLYQNLYDIAESLGLVSEGGDSAGFVAKVLTTLFTMLTAGIRTTVAVVNFLVDGFINLYNKSEAFRGVVGGLVEVFKGIGKAAWDYLGGLGDLLVGIFTLDVAKIKAGLKASFKSAGDLMYQEGLGAAENFNRGYNNAKDTRIVRKPRAAASADSSESGGMPAEGNDEGNDSLTAAAAAKVAKEEAAKEREREKARKAALAAEAEAAKARLEETKRWVAEEGAHLKTRVAWRAALDSKTMSDEEMRRAKQREKIFEDADKLYDGLTEKEKEQTDVVEALMQDRDLKLRELAAQFAAEDEKKRQEAIDQKIAAEEAANAEQLAQLELDLANGVINEQAYQDAVFAVKMAGAARELALVKEKSGAESTEFKKQNAAMLKDQADFVTKKKTQDEALVKFEKNLQLLKKVMGSEEIDFLGEVLGKKSMVYKAFVVAQKAIALTEIGLNLVNEMSSNAKHAAAMPPPFNVAYLIGSNAMSLVRAGMATAKVAGFRTGGRTSTGGNTMALADITTTSDGRLVDAEGYEIAGVVHKNEYVIPEWMRADPEVARIEQYLEHRRTQGWRGGGDTGDGMVTPVAPAGEGESVALLRRLVAVQEEQNDRINTWAKVFEVELSIDELERELESRKNTRLSNGIK